jgi:hypothetical protein
MVIRSSEGGLITDWYQKDVSSKRILNYYSHHPHAQRVNTARSFVNRVLDLSSVEFHGPNKLKIKEILAANNYPGKCIAKWINAYRPKLFLDERSETDSDCGKKYRRLTYVRGMSEEIGKVVRTYSPDVRLAYGSSCCLRGLFTKLKDKVPVGKQTEVIYEIPCAGSPGGGGNCNLTYVGQTKQHLEKRLNDHRRDLTRSINPAVPRTALADHCLTVGHVPAFDRTVVLDRASHYGRRLTIEALHIYANNTMNVKRDSDQIAPVYCAVIDDNKARENKRRAHTLLDDGRNAKRQRLK